MVSLWPRVSASRPLRRAWSPRRRGSVLAELGCDVAQGFLISRPLPMPDLIEWLGIRQSLTDVGAGVVVIIAVACLLAILSVPIDGTLAEAAGAPVAASPCGWCGSASDCS